jgi:hypothetical protein
MIEKFTLSGSYMQNGEPGRLTGDFEISSSGLIVGFMVDESSSTPERQVCGRLERTSGKTILDLLVIVPNTGDSLLDLKYRLEKTGSSSVSGRYTGTWTPVEKQTSMRVTGGAIELPSGNICYPAEIEKLVPRTEDLRKQDAEIYLEKVA